MQKSLLLVFAFSIIASPILAWGEGGCSFSKKNKAIQEENIEQLEKSLSSDE